MQMTQKHFEFIAQLLKGAHAVGPEVVAYVEGNEIDAVDYEVLVKYFTDNLAQTNPKFKPELFRKACDLGEN